MSEDSSHVVAVLAHQRNLAHAKATADKADAAGVDEALDRYAKFRADFDAAADSAASLRALDSYRRWAKSAEASGNRSLATRTKFYSSIMEEVPALLALQRVPQGGLPDRRIVVGGAKVAIRCVATLSGDIDIETKMMDFAVAVRDEHMGCLVPLLGLEVKKYVDKTMFDTILATRDSLAILRPRTWYGFMVEDEARSDDVITNSRMFGDEFILSGRRRTRQDDTLNQLDPLAWDRFCTALWARVGEQLDMAASHADTIKARKLPRAAR